MDRLTSAYRCGTVYDWEPTHAPLTVWMRDQANMRLTWCRDEKKRMDWLIDLRDQFYERGLDKAAYKVEQEIRESVADTP